MDAEEEMKEVEPHRAPGRQPWKRGTKLRRGAATQVVSYPRARSKAVLVQASRELGVSLSSLLIGSGLAMAAKLAGCSVADLVPKAELRQYMRGHGSDRVGIEFWTNAPLISESPKYVGRTLGGSMAVKTDSILELEDRAQKLQALASLLKDPSLNDVVSKLFRDAPVLTATTTPARYRTPHSSSAALTEAIREIATELPRPFTASDVVVRLKQRQFVFRRAAMDATRDCLYRLSRGKRRLFRILEMGQGGKPNKYVLIS